MYVEKSLMSITLTLLESDKTIAKNINQAIADFINNKLNSQKKTLLNNAKKLITKWIKKQKPCLLWVCLQA